MACEIRIDKFEGPLDLLLHLIKKDEMDIYDIPVASITTQYLAFLDEMKSLNLDVAGEYLVMAATLLLIKSKMLLPQTEDELPEEEEIDPRAELVRRLLEYQRYKDAAVTFDRQPQLERDVFTHPQGVLNNEPEASETPELEPVGIFELVEAFRGLLKQVPAEYVHEISSEQLSVTERIHQILSTLQQHERISFTTLVPDQLKRPELVVMFLAMLELVKMKMVKIYQNNRCGEIWLFPAVALDAESDVTKEDDLGYA